MKFIMESWRKFLKEDEVGKRLTVYRIGSSVGELSNRNAANLKGIIAFMDTECEDLKPAYCFPKGITITEYEIELTAPTVDYKCLRGGTSRNPFSMDGDKTSQCPAEAGVGVREGSGWGDLSYSFLEEGQGWKLVSVGKSIPIVDVPDNIGYIGWVEALEILEGLFSGGELNEEEEEQELTIDEKILKLFDSSGAQAIELGEQVGANPEMMALMKIVQTGVHKELKAIELYTTQPIPEEEMVFSDTSRGQPTAPYIKTLKEQQSLIYPAMQKLAAMILKAKAEGKVLWTHLPQNYDEKDLEWGLPVGNAYMVQNRLFNIGRTLGEGWVSGSYKPGKTALGSQHPDYKGAMKWAGKPS